MILQFVCRGSPVDNRIQTSAPGVAPLFSHRFPSISRNSTPEPNLGQVPGDSRRLARAPGSASERRASARVQRSHPLPTASGPLAPPAHRNGPQGDCGMSRGHPDTFTAPPHGCPPSREMYECFARCSLPAVRGSLPPRLESDWAVRRILRGCPIQGRVLRESPRRARRHGDRSRDEPRVRHVRNRAHRRRQRNRRDKPSLFFR
jgi:hypothetical protein